jgi:hypothetical protein
MQNVRSWRFGQAALAAALLVALAASPATAFDLFAQHQVSVQFATPDGKPMADAKVRVFAPGQSGEPTLTGHTDGNGKFEFAADRDGFWAAEARTGDEIARVMVRVGSGGPAPEEAPPSPYWIWGGLLVLLILAFCFRILRARGRRSATK